VDAIYPVTMGGLLLDLLLTIHLYILVFKFFTLRVKIRVDPTYNLKNLACSFQMGQRTTFGKVLRIWRKPGKNFSRSTCCQSCLCDSKETKGRLHLYDVL